MTFWRQLGSNERAHFCLFFQKSQKFSNAHHRADFKHLYLFQFWVQKHIKLSIFPKWHLSSKVVDILRDENFKSKRNRSPGGYRSRFDRRGGDGYPDRRGRGREEHGYLRRRRRDDRGGGRDDRGSGRYHGGRRRSPVTHGSSRSEQNVFAIWVTGDRFWRLNSRKTISYPKFHLSGTKIIYHFMTMSTKSDFRFCGEGVIKRRSPSPPPKKKKKESSIFGCICDMDLEIFLIKKTKMTKLKFSKFTKIFIFAPILIDHKSLSFLFFASEMSGDIQTPPNWQSDRSEL